MIEQSESVQNKGRGMKTIALISFVSATLAGCVSPLTYDQQRQLAKTDSDEELCLVTVVHPKYKKAAEDELTDRNATCDWQKVQLLMQAKQMQAQQQAAQSQQVVNSLMILNALQPRPAGSLAPTPPIQTTCRRLGQAVNCLSQ